MSSEETPIEQTENIDSFLTLQDIIDGIEDELLVIDGDYRIRFASLAIRGKSHKPNESPIGQPCHETVQERDRPCSAPLWDCPLREVLSTGDVRTFTHPLHNGGVDRYLKITMYPLRDNQGNIRAVVELRRNVTAERELETQILRRHHQLLVLSHISGAVSGLSDLDAVLRIALDNVLELISGAVGGILLLNQKTQTLSYRVQRGLSVGFTEDRQIALGEGIAGRVAQTGEPMLVKDVSKDPRAARPDLVTAEGIKGFISVPLKSKDKVVGVMNIFSHVAGRFGGDDVSLLNSIGDYLGTAIAQTRLYERLARVGERYKLLLQYSLTAQEQERKRIARELHDETSQSLTSLTLSLQAIIGLAELKGYIDTDFIEKLKKTHSYAVHVGNEIVKLMKELRPTLLDELGLPAAIHRYAKDNLQTQGINVSAEFTGAEKRLPSEVEVTLFRIAQGAMGNIREHAEAKNVSIKLECDKTQCSLVVADDGKGFDVSKFTQVEPGGRGAGLFIMRERTNLLSGTAHIESQAGQGTKVIVKVPLAGTVEDLAKDEADAEDKSTNS